MGQRFDTGRGDFIQLIDITEHLAELFEVPEFFLGAQPEPGQTGDLADFFK